MPSFPKFEDWQAPWKDDKDFDPERAKTLIYSLTKEAAETKERHAARLAEVGAERDALKQAVEEHETKGLNEVEKLTRELERLKEQRAKPAEQSLEIVRLRLALEHKLTEAQAKRLVGSTAEELAADAKVYAEEIGASGSGAGEAPPSRRPAAKLRSGLGDDSDTDALDPAGALALLPPRR